MAKIAFVNYGKTPGIISEVATGIVYSEHVPDPVYDVRIVNANVIAAGDLTEDFGTQMTGQFTVGMGKKIRDGAPHLWIFGYVAYDDVFGERQIHRFLQRLVCTGRRQYALQSYDYEHYNRST
jgi:hypothetical protein